MRIAGSLEKNVFLLLKYIIPGLIAWSGIMGLFARSFRSGDPVMFAALTILVGIVSLFLIAHSIVRMTMRDLTPAQQNDRSLGIAAIMIVPAMLIAWAVYCI